MIIYFFFPRLAKYYIPFFGGNSIQARGINSYLKLISGFPLSPVYSRQAGMTKYFFYV
jgi:hypothetical protein